MTRTVPNRPAALDAQPTGVGPLGAAAMGRDAEARGTRDEILLGVLPGEGVGPEVIGGTLRVLDALADAGGPRIQTVTGGEIGLAAEAAHGAVLTDAVTEFCRETFAARGAILCGPGGGRFVYDLREALGLYCKFSPIRCSPALAGLGRFCPEHLRGVDMLVVRDNAGGIYQGVSTTQQAPGAPSKVVHRFSYEMDQVRRIAEAAARAAATRGRRVAVVIKAGALPEISRMWCDATADAASSHRVAWESIDIDYAAYRVIHDPRSFDVLLAPNLFGDVLADLAAVLIGSRGASYSGNFSLQGDAVYQTNHGSAHDLVGTDAANPVGQILSAAMMLRESFGRPVEADLIERAVDDVWSAGIRTADIAEPGATTVGTEAMANRIAESVRRLADRQAR